MQELERFHVTYQNSSLSQNIFIKKNNKRRQFDMFDKAIKKVTQF